jgi:hypothetical protein
MWIHSFHSDYISIVYFVPVKLKNLLLVRSPTQQGQIPPPSVHIELPTEGMYFIFKYIWIVLHILLHIINTLLRNWSAYRPNYGKWISSEDFSTYDLCRQKFWMKFKWNELLLSFASGLMVSNYNHGWDFILCIFVIFAVSFFVLRI